MTSLENMTTPYSIFSEANTVSGGYMGVMILVTVYLITFSLLKARYDTKTTFMGSSAIILFVCGLLLIVNMATNTMLGICIFLFVISIVISSWGD